ncbi:MAG: monovalent cation:proton antiporter-2 (CPA2) family protein [Xanthomonadaceae bacterium]|nr:monovalent cation:proton antiporter-2 (CPA2) family protein [Xanthomonadaceae bacterium]MDP2185833.1 monovalent cation:proton antiporter-2 (CPA2) family protein [Xanthomonadales bacterium]MDZ4116489.1 monovalent cation:proton antiporter-2 (CPA2) family protein [Xanthomonadaceae bacterium]MDZ4379116.1 monovalent cation:proton antiporter-2 (CPA2) family protein [Xanthomonadaceae bacterium]
MHPHGALEILLIFLIAAVVAVPLFRYLGLSAVLGYLVAGIIIGPDGLHLIADTSNTLALSEFGVVMLLFIIGLELSPARLWLMRRQVFGIGALQVALSAMVISAGLLLLGIGWKAITVLAIGLALSSTAVGLQLLAERKELASSHGRLTFAVLLFQDIIAIPLLAAIPLLGAAKTANLAAPSWSAIGNAVLVIALVVVGGRYALRYLFRIVARARMVEVFTAASLAVVAGTAWLMESVGLSMGLGAFLAGMLLADSEFRHELESHIEPFKGLLLGLFFIAVGMSIDLDVVTARPVTIAVGVLALLSGKGLIMFALGRASGLDNRAALLLAAMLGMGGEFAFVVFGEAMKAQLIDAPLRDLLVVIVGSSMALTPLLLITVSRWLSAHPAPTPERAFDTIEDRNPRVIIAGFGRMGQIVGRMLTARKITFTALENSAEQVDFSRRFGSTIYFGDPARPDLLRAANAANAEVFVLTTDDPAANLRTARIVKRHFPHLRIIARARNRQHAFRLMDMDVGVVRETFHSSLEIGRRVMESLGVPPEQAAEHTARFKARDERLLQEQHLVYDDDAALVASSREALHELENLFAADRSPDPEDVPK